MSAFVKDSDGLLASLGDLSDLDAQNYRVVQCDMTWRMLINCLGVQALLMADLRYPAMTVTRAVFELAANQVYLWRHERREFEANVFTAFSHLKRIGHYPGDSGLIAERRGLLARMPEDTVAEAERRLGARPFTMSGKSLRRVAEEAGVEGYDAAYDPLSAEAHSNLVGETVQVVRIGSENKRVVQLGAPLSTTEKEYMANFARRSLKHSSSIMAEALSAEVRFKFSSIDPDRWYTART